VDNGTLSGGTITVGADPVCIGETITFTAGGVVDSGGTEWVNCVEQPISAGGIAYAWQLTLPPDYPEPRPPTTGTGTSVSVTAQVPGTYAAPKRSSTRDR